MVSGMATTKITITLPDDQIEQIRALVDAGVVGSISAFVKHSVGIGLSDAAAWKDMLEEGLRQTGGPLTKQERNWADEILGPPKQTRRSSKKKAA